MTHVPTALSFSRQGGYEGVAMNTPQLFFTILSIVACFVALAANGYVPPQVAYWGLGFFTLAAAVAWFCKASLLKTVIAMGLSLLALVSLARSAGNNWRVFSEVLTNLLVIGILLFTMIMMLFGPFRPKK